MLSLAESNKTPKQLSLELGIHQNNVSKTLKQLKEKELVEVVNIKIRKGRIYRLTNFGSEIAKKLK